MQPSWIFSTSGQLRDVETQAYFCLPETWYPFTFAVEVGPQFIQTAAMKLQTTLGSFFDVGYVMNPKTRTFVPCRPGLSFGGSAYPAASQISRLALTIVSDRPELLVQTLNRNSITSPSATM